MKKIKTLSNKSLEAKFGKLEGGFEIVNLTSLVVGGNTDATNRSTYACVSGNANCPSNNCTGGNCGNCGAGCGAK